jgi:alpha-D-ribose 1-methylphosphonate 5-triphosphate synthase subunit PhnH
MTKVEPFDAVYDTQQIYRKLLDCMARPGKVNSIEPYLVQDDHESLFSKPLLSLAFTLVDREVSFHVISDLKEKAEQYIYWQTFSKAAELHEAHYVFIGKQLSDSEIQSVMNEVKAGTLEDPHLSATILIQVNTLTDSPGDGMKLKLTGPGIQGTREVYADGMPSAWIAERKKINSEYPLGVDMILTTSSGEIMAIPRTTLIVREEI